MMGAWPALSWTMSGAGVYWMCSWVRMSAAIASTPRACSSVKTAGGMKPRTPTAAQPSLDSFSFISSRLGMRSWPMPVASRPSRYTEWALSVRWLRSWRRMWRHTAWSLGV
jgi:hypothetical protein